MVGPEWKSEKRPRSYLWISNEHCMSLVGYDEENYYFNDPYENHGAIGYPKAVVENVRQAQHMAGCRWKR
ncbi:MAG: C39 family peptidase [Bifidobacterium pseudocatenulatum]